ncbi:hypothetical protein UFOVP418_1 [uncultured Caudovirales phage]|uniref:Uncharacterized protein n=1 Tax=uncultured Caudovirales phage TaxID=2100421 RepID=A0A6J5M3M9_9CAUD|nr:hypothetical protein UFOVP418_1 [uncultured Caudovirales phage]
MSKKRSDKAKQEADKRFAVWRFEPSGFYAVADLSLPLDAIESVVARNITNPLHAETIRQCYVAMWFEQWQIDEALGTHEPVEIKYEVMP